MFNTKKKDLDMSKMVVDICSTTGCTENKARDALAANNYDIQIATHKILDAAVRDDSEEGDGWQTISRVKKVKKKTDVSPSGDGNQSFKSSSYGRNQNNKQNKFKNVTTGKFKNYKGPPRKPDVVPVPSVSTVENVSDTELKWDNAADIEGGFIQEDSVSSTESAGFYSSDDFGEESVKPKKNVDEQTYHGIGAQLVGKVRSKHSSGRSLTSPCFSTNSSQLQKQGQHFVKQQLSSEQIIDDDSTKKSLTPSDATLLSNLLSVFGKYCYTKPPNNTAINLDKPVVVVRSAFHNHSTFGLGELGLRYTFGNIDAANVGGSQCHTTINPSCHGNTANQIHNKEQQQQQQQVLADKCPKVCSDQQNYSTMDNSNNSSGNNNNKYLSVANSVVAAVPAGVTQPPQPPQPSTINPGGPYHRMLPLSQNAAGILPGAIATGTNSTNVPSVHSPIFVAPQPPVLSYDHILKNKLNVTTNNVTASSVGNENFATYVSNILQQQKNEVAMVLGQSSHPPIQSEYYSLSGTNGSSVHLPYDDLSLHQQHQPSLVSLPVAANQQSTTPAVSVVGVDSGVGTRDANISSGNFMQNQTFSTSMNMSVPFNTVMK